MLWFVTRLRPPSHGGQTILCAAVFGISVLVSGCQSVVALSGLERVDDEVPSYRLLSAAGDSAYLRANDIVTLTPKNGTVLVDAGCGGAPECSEPWAPVETVAQGHVARIPVTTLSCMKSADIVITTANGATKSGSVKLEPGSAGGSTCIAFSREHWIRPSDLRQRIAQSKLPISVAILRGVNQKVLPGDQIDIDMRFQVGPGAGADSGNAPKIQQNSHSSAVLDNTGIIQIDAPGPIEPLPSASKARGRVARAAGFNAELSAQVWKPGACSSEQPSLDDVSVCLAGSWSPEDNPQRARYCALQLGIDGMRRNAEQANNDWLNAGYRLGAGQKWTLVGDDGVAHQQPYTGAIPVGKAVTLGYRALYGRDVLRTSFQRRRAFVTVVPDANRCSSERVPLSGVVDLNKDSILDNMALLPGDAVHVRYSSPVR